MGGRDVGASRSVGFGLGFEVRRGRDSCRVGTPLSFDGGIARKEAKPAVVADSTRRNPLGEAVLSRVAESIRN